MFGVWTSEMLFRQTLPKHIGLDFTLKHYLYPVHTSLFNPGWYGLPPV